MLDVLFWGLKASPVDSAFFVEALEISKLQFLIKKMYIFFHLKFFSSNCWSSKPWIPNWIWNRIKPMRIRNPACKLDPESKRNWLFLVQGRIRKYLKFKVLTNLQNYYKINSKFSVHSASKTQVTILYSNRLAQLILRKILPEALQPVFQTPRVHVFFRTKHPQCNRLCKKW